MKIWKYILRGGAILNRPQVNSHYGFDTGTFVLGFIGFILLLAVVIILAMTMETEWKLLPKKREEVSPQSVWIGGCAGTRYGCCPDGLTTRYDQSGTNCIDQVLVGGCDNTEYGCCKDGLTAKRDKMGTNCEKIENCANSQYGCCSDDLTMKVDEKGSNCPPVK
jgi:hypothetical protein